MNHTSQKLKSVRSHTHDPRDIKFKCKANTNYHNSWKSRRINGRDIEETTSQKVKNRVKNSPNKGIAQNS